MDDAEPLTKEGAAHSLRASTKTILTSAPCTSATNVGRAWRLVGNCLVDHVSAGLADHMTRVAAS
jgi:hypothetical protein